LAARISGFSAKQRMSVTAALSITCSTCAITAHPLCTTSGE
jgi:hypothetical protein